MNEKHSLLKLSKDFFEYIISSKRVEIDLNEVEKKLGVSKRRLYDVINVLTGIGLVERCGKAKIKWCGDPKSFVNNEVIEDLIQKNEEIDQMISDIDKFMINLLNSEDFKNYAWINENDINNSIKKNDSNIYILKGPLDLSINHDKNENNEIILNCKSNIDEVSFIELTDL